VDPAAERAAVRATIDRIEAASGTRPLGWLGAGLAETWNTLDYLTEAGIRYVCDWVNDDQPYQFEIGTPPLVSLPYSVQTIMCLSLLTLPLIGGLVALPHLDHKAAQSEPSQSDKQQAPGARAALGHEDQFPRALAPIGRQYVADVLRSFRQQEPVERGRRPDE
jgi:peptidoglycan/xylan/chitin deacetylase (PgdA/CDA1 family)